MNPMDYIARPLASFGEISTPSIGKKRVLLRAPVLTQSGYGVHSRQIARWLLSRKDVELEVQALPWGDTPWLIDGSREGGMIERLMEKTVDPKGRRYDATIQVQLPNEWDPTLSSVNVGVTAGVETDRCSPAWVEACNKMSRVVVPSSHTKKVIVESGRVVTRIDVVPESFPDDVLTHVDAKPNVVFDTPFNFLVFGQITGNNPENDRKNIFYTIKWICEAFSGDESVGIVVKTNMGRNTTLDRVKVKHVMQTLVREVRKSNFPRIHLVHGDMSDSEVTSLYRHPQIKALVALSRGEGFGLPILEAAANGLPVIATRWSGHTDFLTPKKYIDVNYTLAPIHKSRVDGSIFVEGSRWANPLEEDVKKKLIKFRNSPDIPKEWALEMSREIREKYSFSSISTAWSETLRDTV